MVEAGEPVYVYEDDSIRIVGPKSFLDPMVHWYNAWDFGGKFLINSIVFYGTGLLAEVEGAKLAAPTSFSEMEAIARERFGNDYYVPRFVVVQGQPMPIFYLPEDHNLQGAMVLAGELDPNNLDHFNCLPLLITATAIYEPLKVRQLFCGIDLCHAWQNCYHVLKRHKAGEEVDPSIFAINGWGFITAAAYLESIGCSTRLTEVLTTIGKRPELSGTSLDPINEPMTRVFRARFIDKPMLEVAPIAPLDASLTRFSRQFGPFLRSRFFPPPEMQIPDTDLNNFLNDLEVCLEFPLHY